MSGKRGNGEGSIYQRRSDGRWLAVLVLPDGRRRTFTAKTRTEAGKRLNAALEAKERGTLSTSKRVSVEAYLAAWLRDSVKPRVRPSTYTSYELHTRRFIVPAIGRLALDKLEPPQVQELLNSMATSGSSPRTVAHVRQTLRTALGQAQRWGLVSRNAASLADAPRVERHEFRSLSPGEAEAFLRAVQGDDLEALYSVALTMGLRQGEALGLRWADVALETGTLMVRSQLQRVDGALKLVPTKTARSRRALAMPASITASLRTHRARWAEKRLQVGPRWKGADPKSPEAFVFTTPIGTALDARNVLRAFKVLLEKAGLPDMRFHDLRHSCASLLLARGIHPRVVMEMLGHSQISLTMNTYSHVVPELMREAATTMDDILGR